LKRNVNGQSLIFVYGSLRGKGVELYTLARDKDRVHYHILAWKYIDHQFVSLDLNEESVEIL